MKFIEVNVTEKEFAELAHYGTVWYHNKRIVVAIEIQPNVTLNLWRENPNASKG